MLKSALFALAKNTFQETIRDRILYTIAFFAGALILSSKLMAGISAGEAEKITLDFGLGMIHIFGILITLFVGTQMIAKEMDGKTILILLSKPISRASFIFGKFLGLSAVLLLLLTIMGGIFLFLVPFQIEFLLVFAGIYFSFLLLLAMALFFSSFLSPLLAMFSTLLMFILGNITDDFYLFVEHTKSQISAAFYWTGWGAFHFLPNFENINFKNSVAYQITASPLDSALFFAQAILYIMVLLVFAVLIFRKKEF